MAANNGTPADSAEQGGKHYKDVPDYLQHWNVVHALGWDYYLGAATKYLWRLGKKDDPVVELDKAIHFLQKKKELILADRAFVIDGVYFMRALKADEDPNGDIRVVFERPRQSVVTRVFRVDHEDKIERTEARTELASWAKAVGIPGAKDTDRLLGKIFLVCVNQDRWTFHNKSKNINPWDKPENF